MAPLPDTGAPDFPEKKFLDNDPDLPYIQMNEEDVVPVEGSPAKLPPAMAS